MNNQYNALIHWLRIANRKNSSELKSRVFKELNRIRAKKD